MALPFEAQRNTISITIVFHEMLIGSVIEAERPLWSSRDRIRRRPSRRLGARVAGFSD